MEKARKKKWSLRYTRGDSAQDAAIRKLAAETGVTDPMACLLYTRGLHSKEAVQSFLHQDEATFHDPFALKDMEAAVERIERALNAGEKIRIYGDYDVDGVTSVSLLYLYLKSRGADVGYYIPSRAREGYGLSTPAIDTLKEDHVSLMITVDTGITANDETRYAKELGIETVITDHHECHADLPDVCAVVNPHRPDDEYPFKELAGVGVVFKLVCAMEMTVCRRNGIPDLKAVKRICETYADLVSIGTIADVMPIVDENRLIVTYGLSQIEKTKRPGLAALIDAASGGNKKRKINSGFIGFGIAPRMNAAGRVSSASIAVELLLAEEEDEARRLADELCKLNTDRQVEENRIAEQAYKKIDQMLEERNDRVIVVDDDTWQQGIIGIVSSRITERYGLPSILISFDGSTRGFAEGDDLGKGSGRSIRGLNLVEALAHCEDLLVRFGGHELAAGLTIRRANIDEFRERINEYAGQCLDGESLCVSLDADCEVGVRDLTMKLAEEIERLEPFGVSNPIPSFILSGVTVRRVVQMGGGKHCKLTVEKDGIQMNAVWFGMNQSHLPFDPADPVDMLFQLNINVFQGITSLQLIVQDARVTPSFEDELTDARERYEEIRRGDAFDESENVIPTRDDMAEVYKLLRREFYNGHTVFPMRRLLCMTRAIVPEMNYIKLKMIIRIMQELQVCEISEPTDDSYVFAFAFQTAKTNIEKSSILRKLKTQVRKTGGAAEQ